MAMGLLSMDGVWTLYADVSIGGCGYGGVNLIFPTICAEIFRSKDLPIVYPLVGGVTFSLGSLLFSTLLYGTLFDLAQERHGLIAVQPCIFADCYRPAVLLAAASCSAAVVLWCWVTLLAKSVYAHHSERVAADGKSSVIWLL